MMSAGPTAAPVSAPPPALPTDDAHTERVHVRFSVGIETYALPIENVLEVADLGGLTAVPGAGASLLGVCNFEGQVLPVFDLALVLALPGHSRPRRLIVIELAGCVAGVAVDDVTDVEVLRGAREETAAELLAEAVLDGNVLVGVLDVERLFAALGGNAT